jgi:hypothetical protein
VRAALLVTSAVVLVCVGVASAQTPPFTPIPPTVPRPVGERVPTAARFLKIAWTRPGRHPILITDRAEVLAVAHILDQLPVEGKGVCSEGFILGPPTVSFKFLRSRNGPGIATAREAAHQNYGVAWCVPTLFSIPGHRTLRLEGGSYLLTEAAKILHRNLNAA